VACSGKLAAVAAYQQGTLWIYDFSNPANPTIQNSFDTTLAAQGGTGIGAISLDGTKVLVGEAGGPNIVLMNASTGAPIASCVAEDFADGGVQALALKGNTAIVSGQFNFDVVNYVGTSTLTTMPYIIGGSIGRVIFQGPIVCDFDGATAVLGDGSGNVYAFSIAAGQLKEFLGASSAAGPVSSVTVSGKQVAAGSISDVLVALIRLGSGAPVGFAVVSSTGGDSGGAVKFDGRGNLAGSTNNGTGVTYFGTSAWPAATTFGVAAGANLNPTLWPTMGFTEVELFKLQPIPPWMEPILKKLFG
jgi:hypothetical protein